MKSIHRILLLVVFTIWVGGFTFYAAVVVPIGTEILESSRSQGFITQRVTVVLNWIGAFTLILVCSDFFLHVRNRSGRINRVLLVTIIVIGALWLVLMAVHPLMDSLLEPEHDFVKDDQRFYQLHRLYLWASSIQWLGCWVWLGCIVYDSKPGPDITGDRPRHHRV